MRCTCIRFVIVSLLNSEEPARCEYCWREAFWAWSAGTGAADWTAAVAIILPALTAAAAIAVLADTLAAVEDDDDEDDETSWLLLDWLNTC